MNRATTQNPPHGVMNFAEFVAFVAACMALNALAIDIMLPALPDLNATFALGDPNRPQAVIAIYLVGMGLSQLVYGPLSDRFGRRPVLLGGLALFSIAGLLSALAPSFELLLVGRVVQGIGAGAGRVIAMSLARDTYSGRQLGRVMSLAMMLFMAAPILAPSLGQLILMVAPWRWTFGALVAGGLLVLLWALLRLQETLPPQRRRPFSPAAVWDAYRITLTSRASAGYTAALALVFGAQMGFVISAQAIFSQVFDAADHFGVLFAAVALAMAVAAFANSRLVLHWGRRRLAKTSLVTLIVLNLGHLAIIEVGLESLPLFMVLQAASVFMFGFLGANLNALAMDPLGQVAGTASSAIGFVNTTGGALIGFVIGQLFDGTVLPLTLGYIGLGLGALAVVGLAGRTRGPGPATCCAPAELEPSRGASNP